MQALIRNMAQRAAKIFRGPSYKLDTNVTVTALMGFTIRRAISLLRCILRGLALKPGKWFFVGTSVVLRNRSFIRFGRGATIGNFVLIDGLSRNGVVIGDGVNIGAYTIIEATGVISNLGVGCRIGVNSGIGAFSFIGAAGGVDIGNNVIMGQYVSFHSENHCFEDTERPIRMQGVTRQGIVIEDDCWIGAKVTFLDGCHIGRGSVIAAGAVVRGSIPPYSVAVGVPAKVIKSRQRYRDA
ncbi:acyltransferase [Thiohalomonas denitrificans]|uniref:acyltransferase n=1 Tax=Thiohalomonas denitrificans TaxID=415747 RepID=UPI002480FAF7|nr:acyltransferase [Thiohalomonas denitrificans]